MCRAESKSNLKPNVWFPVFLVPMLIGFAVHKSGNGHIAAYTVAIGLHFTTWLGWTYLTLVIPLDVKEHSQAETAPPIIYNRLIHTLIFGAMISAIAICAGIVVALTQNPKISTALSFVPLLPAYAFLGGLGIAYALLPIVAQRNRTRTQPIRRCIVDALNIALSICIASVAATTALIICKLAYPEVPRQALTNSALCFLAVIAFWRIAPIILPQKWFAKRT